MTFDRNRARNWHRDVPGARWFKADLHVHTMDDLPGGRAKLPSRVVGPPDSDETLATYAPCFLRSAVERQVRVIGITPHSPRMADGAESSAVWRIVEEWNCGADDDGEPFREKNYAVFPGFEPALNAGKSGLHLLFLFDPEIGRDRYLKAFDLVMGGRSPWRGHHLAMSGRNAEDAFRELRALHGQQAGKDPDDPTRWNFLTLAPHIDNEKGLLGAQKGQVLERFRHGDIAGLELGDNKLPQETVSGRKWLRNGMHEHRQAFFHSSDAYSVDDIGERHTWLKLARPRIEALRQAFIASDSRMRIGYERDAHGELIEIAAPDVTVNERPWLKTVTVKGRASFFGGKDDSSVSRFDLSPDLTCIIGGSMTGRSTFLDGLRVHAGAPLPQDEGIREQVEARGRDGFLSGSPEVVLECPGSDPTAAVACVAYAGQDRASEVLQVADAGGRLNEQVDRAMGWFLGLGRFESYGPLIRDDRHLLPRPAIREALVNAVTHRDYALKGDARVQRNRTGIGACGAGPIRQGDVSARSR